MTPTQEYCVLSSSKNFDSFEVARALNIPVNTLTDLISNNGLTKEHILKLRPLIKD